MPSLARILAIFILLGALTLPAPASALGISFGGRVISSIPCMSPLGPSLYVITVPMGFTFISPLIWTPATITYTVGPPLAPGQQVLGVADVPYACSIGSLSLFGLRMQMVGTSVR